jgi:hypothetical protein
MCNENNYNKTITILFHTISYYLRETNLDIDDSEKEQIEYMICQGFSEGSLTMSDPANPDIEYHGYWKIKK